MADHAKTFWTSPPAHGPAGKFRVIVARVPATAGATGQRDRYSATLYRAGDDGDEAVEQEFWQHNAPPHDMDKLAFREKARRAAENEGQAHPL